METVAHSKSDLRQKFKDLRRRASSDAAASAQLASNLKRFLRDYSQVQCCAYRARPDEAPCEVDSVSDFFYPVMKGEALEFRRPGSIRSFRKNDLNIEEPVVDQSDALDTGLPVLILCPALAVDADGVRLGMGKGYYDRFFAAHPHALRVGVVFHVQFSTAPLPADSWDQKLDWVVSEKMILRTSTRSSSSWI